MYGQKQSSRLSGKKILNVFFFIKYKPEPDSPQLLINWLSDFSKCMVSAESLHLLSATHSNKGLLYSLPSIVNIFLLLGKVGAPKEI